MSILQNIEAAIEEIVAGYYERKWDYIATALTLLGVEIPAEYEDQPVKATKSKIKAENLAAKPQKKPRGRPKKQEVVEAPKVQEDFTVTNRKPTRGKQGDRECLQEEVKLGPRENLFDKMVASLEMPADPKSKRGKKYDDKFFQQKVYPKTRVSIGREPVKKIDIECENCGTVDTLYENRVIYKDAEEGIYWCNRCSGGV